VRSVQIDRDMGCVMRDGATLRADVWRPADSDAYPVLLQRTPYNKADSQQAIVYGALEPIRAVEAGYAVVVQDVRGRFASDGDFDPFRSEASDGEDTLTWLATQPWSDGRVMMYGQSYFGATQLLAATTSHPALKAIAPHLTASEYYEGWTYEGGAFQLGFALYWVLAGLAPVQLARLVPSEQEALRPGLETLLNDTSAAFAYTPYADLSGVDLLAPYYREWIDHPRRDGYWNAVAINERYDRIRVSALHIGGWHDIFLKGTLENFTRLVGAARQRLIVGPWAHGNLTDAVGAVDYGSAASEASLDMTAKHLQFFDGVLGRSIDDSPEVSLFVMGENRWREFDSWPPAESSPRDWFLGEGMLQHTAADGAPDTFAYDPNDPVPTVGGPNFLPGLFISRLSGEQPQTVIEERDDVLLYTSAPLLEDLVVIGPLRVHLFASTDAEDTDFTARLTDVHPDGGSFSVADGIRRGRYRLSTDKAQFAEPGNVEEYVIDLGATARVFACGHRIRLQVSSSNYPRFDRNPNSTVEPALAAENDFRIAHQTVLHNPTHPSRLVMSVMSK